IHAEVGSKEFLNGLEDPLLALHRRLRAVRQLPSEVLLCNFLKRPLCHLGRLRLGRLKICLALLQELLTECERFHWIASAGRLAALLSAVIAPLEPDER